jgi:hypothetical protein
MPEPSETPPIAGVAAWRVLPRSDAIEPGRRNEAFEILLPRISLVRRNLVSFRCSFRRATVGDSRAQVARAFANIAWINRGPFI